MGLDMDISDSKGNELVYMRKQYPIDQYLQDLYDDSRERRYSICCNNFRIFKTDITRLVKYIQSGKIEVYYNRKDEIISNLNILLSKWNSKEKYYYNYTC